MATAVKVIDEDGVEYNLGAPTVRIRNGIIELRCRGCAKKRRPPWHDVKAYWKDNSLTGRGHRHNVCMRCTLEYQRRHRQERRAS